MSAFLERPLRLYPNSPDSFLGRLIAKMDELGIQPGDEFALVSRSAVSAPRTPGARNTDPGTSKAAALDAMPRTGTQREKLLDAIVRSGEKGLTFEEAGAATGVPSPWKRLSELHEGRWIEDSGKTRKGNTGSEQTVWVASRKGQAAFGLVPAGPAPVTPLVGNGNGEQTSLGL